MTPLKIGACLAPHEIVDHREWLFGADRDIELQGFCTHKDQTTESADRIATAKQAVAGFNRRLAMHGPCEGFDMDNKNPEFRPIITSRYLKALAACSDKTILWVSNPKSANLLSLAPHPAQKRRRASLANAKDIAAHTDLEHSAVVKTRGPGRVACHSCNCVRQIIPNASEMEDREQQRRRHVVG